MPQSLGYSYGLWSGFSRFGIARKINEIFILGFGGVISPLICQTLVAAGVPWKQFYFWTLVLSGFNTGLLSLTFKPTKKEWKRERDQSHRQNISLTRRNTESTIFSPNDKFDIDSSSGTISAVMPQNIRGSGSGKI